MIKSGWCRRSREAGDSSWICLAKFKSTATHTDQEVTFKDMLNCEHEMAPGLDKITADSPAPLVADANGRYPVPQPGYVTKREY